MTAASLEELTALLGRVEQAEGADRGIDGRIALHLEGWAFHFDTDYRDDWPDIGGHWLPPNCWRQERNRFECQCKSDTFFDEPDEYTASLDAALGLCERVLPAWCIATIGQQDDKSWWVEMREGARTSYNRVADSDARIRFKTPALALLAAMLKALISQLQPFPSERSGLK